MENLKQLTKNFKALANERRLKILKQLLGKKHLSVGEISEKINLSFRSTSKHLKVLENASFIDSEQTSANVYYFISSNVSAEILKLIEKLN